jgi:23S rRNA (guanine745-N1)-methyltransferase
MSMIQRLRCPVRACLAALAEAPGGFACERGHRFDRARGGALNLLQPDQRRSSEPGDPASAVAARERLAAAGVDAALRDLLVGLVLDRELEPDSGLLEIGCGVGSLLVDLAAATPGERFGIDLAAEAVRIAARRTRPALCLVANADHRLPFLDASLDLALSIKAPRPLAELARVVRPGGRLLLGLPTPDDLLELRQETAGAGLTRDPSGNLLESMPPGWTFRERCLIRERRWFPADELRDLAAIAYRGQRRREAERLASLSGLEVTLGTQLFELERRSG